jgi:outer membrane receptor protein involved in Fe transport
MHKHPNRRAKAPALTQIAALIATSSFAAMMAAPVYAQSTPAAQADAAKAEEAAKKEGAGLNRIVVTGVSQRKSKMRSSVSVTDIDQDQIKDSAPRTEAEVLLLIPGIRTEATAGPGGNANISVRGLPIASGGSKYVQLQEDGLPTVQFGDMNFSNNDYWIRFDNNVDSIQTLRGGSSAVFASHAPGAVINYISKTGKQQGGSVGLSAGLNFKEIRTDADYGGRLASDMYYHIGGYYREGEGSRRSTENSLLGYQLKGNLTKEFNGTKGYFRVNFKALNEHAPTTPQTFLNAKLSGTSVGSFSLTPGYDGARDSQYSIYNNSFTSIDPVSRAVTTTSLTDGISVNSKSVGFEFHNEMANGFSVDNKFRKSTNAGAFQAQFWNVRTLANLLGDPSRFGATPEARYFNGPQAGAVVTSTNLGTGLVSDSAAINTQTPDMGNLVNDLSVNKKFDLDVGTLDTRVGFYHMRQNVVQRWAISERVMQAAPNGALIDIYNATGAAGTAFTTGGLTGYNNQWGGCCARDINAQFTTDAPYLALNLAAGQLDLDAGVRQEQFRANGHYSGPKKLAGGLDVNGDGVITGAETNVYVADTTNPGLVNYKINYTNYSLGANYRLTEDMSGFVRHSKGNRAISDRLLFSPNINSATGLLSPGGGASAALAPVQQSELGAKVRGATPFGNFGLSATLFHSTTNEFDYDQTRQDNPALPNYQGPKLNQLGYKADGLELESVNTFGSLGLNVNLVYSKEVITSDAAGTAIDNLPANAGNPKTSQVGKTSGGVPTWRYTISPRYAIGDAVVGATVRGQGKVFTGNDNVNTIGGHFIVSAFVNYDFGGGLTGSLNVNNLLDKLYPAGGGGFVGGSSTVFGAGVETGRTINASVRYNF